MSPLHQTAVRTRNMQQDGVREGGHLSIKELWIQEAYRKREFQLVSVDTLLNWADIGTKAHTSERLTSLLKADATTPGRGASKARVCMPHQIE